MLSANPPNTSGVTALSRGRGQEKTDYLISIVRLPPSITMTQTVVIIAREVRNTKDRLTIVNIQPFPTMLAQTRGPNMTTFHYRQLSDEISHVGRTKKCDNN